MSGNNRVKDFFIYRSGVASLAAGASLTDAINIQADAPFIWVKTSYFVDLDGTAITENTRQIPLVNLSIQDSGSGRNLQNNPVPLDAIAGRGALPFVLPQPRIFKANSTIQLTYTNFSTATSYANIYVAMIGYKSFQM